MNNTESPGLYIHVPFCKTKCPYCDFYSITDPALSARLIRSMKAEALLYRDIFPEFDTLYIGGGTPSFIDAVLLEDLIVFLRSTFQFHPHAEITLEMNPDDVTMGKLHFYRSLGINRVSLGVQSFRNKELRLLRRRHTAEKAKEALIMIDECGFTNAGIDLMYGLPRQTKKDWIDTLEEACSFGPAHLSCYQLTIAAETPFGRMQKEGRLMLPSEGKQRNLFLATAQFLANKGFIHYEVSNFARGVEKRSRHNLKYWRRIPYLGIGPSAHSFFRNERWWNVQSVEKYCTILEKGKKPVEAHENLTDGQMELERIFLGFRNLEGIELEDLPREIIAKESLKKLVANGLVKIENKRIIPTTEGYLVADRLPLMISG